MSLEDKLIRLGVTKESIQLMREEASRLAAATEQYGIARRYAEQDYLISIYKAEILKRGGKI